MIQPTSTASQVGAGSNMLSVFDSIQIRNEEKISQSDRDYCEMHQANLYTILDQLDASYEAFRKDAEKYTDEYRCNLKQDGRIDYHDPYRYSSNHDHYKEFQFLPFKSMNAIVEMRAKELSNLLLVLSFLTLIVHIAFQCLHPELMKRHSQSTIVRYITVMWMQSLIIWAVKTSVRKPKKK